MNIRRRGMSGSWKRPGLIYLPVSIVVSVYEHRCTCVCHAMLFRCINAAMHAMPSAPLRAASQAAKCSAWMRDHLPNKAKSNHHLNMHEWCLDTVAPGLRGGPLRQRGHLATPDRRLHLWYHSVHCTACGQPCRGACCLLRCNGTHD